MSRTPFNNPPTGAPSDTTPAINPTGINYRALRDYGATSTNTAITVGSGIVGVPHLPVTYNTVPDVNFAGFSPTEFISLSESIAQNVSAVRSSMHMLEQNIRKIGTHSDSARFRAKLDNEQASTNRKIETTTADLKRLNDVVRHGDKQQKLNVNRLTSEFSSIVEGYYKCQKEIAVKQRINVLPNASHTDDSETGDSYQNGAQQQQVQQQQQQQQQLRQSLEFERDLLLEREERMVGIQNNVLDINAIMQQLGTMTQIQGNNIDMTEGNIENTAGQVEQGMSELEKAAQQQAKYRKKVLLLLLIAVIIGLILTGILVSALK